MQQQNIAQGSDDWLAMRRQGIGASEASIVLGIDPYRDRQDLLDDKLGRGKPFKTNPAMQLGTKFEGVARALSFFDLDIEFTPAVIHHPTLEWMFASLDGQCLLTKTICEIKYMGKKNFDMVGSSKGPLKHHFPQMQHQLAVTGYDRCVYIPYTLTENKQEIDKIAYINIDRDDSYIDRLIQLEKEFWDEVKRCKESA